MNYRLKTFLLPIICLVLTANILSLETYHSPKEVESLLKQWSARYSELASFSTLGKSSGGNSLCLLRISAEGQGLIPPNEKQSVFVAANVEGTHLIGTEAALKLGEKLLTGYGKDENITSFLKTHTVYIAPLLNPDAASRYFARVQWESVKNSRPVDEDLDGKTDEDGPEDLNNDGMITWMRVKDIDGEWIPDPSETRLMKKADPKKGEKGIYKLYLEGTDNDGDGQFNEDPPGGIEVCCNFPHDFDFNNNDTGLWPVSEPETIAVLDFLSSNPQIALILNFSTENTILNLQQTGRAQAAGDKFKVPERYANFLGFDPDKEYTMEEIIAVLKGMNIGGGMEINESVVAMMLGLGPAMDIDRHDRPYFEEVQKEYKEALKKAHINYPEKRAKGVTKGSFVAYSYFQFGVPVFSVDLWAVPEPEKEKKAKEESLTVEKLKEMSSEEFLALGEERIAQFLKDRGAPPNIKASMLMNMVKSGRITPEKMAEMIEKSPQRPVQKEGENPESYILQWSDRELNGRGFVDWELSKHPDLGEVEIGGFVPFLKTAPPPRLIESTVNFHTDFYINLMKKLPCLEFGEVKVDPQGNDVYKLTVYFKNTGWFPTSTAQGRRSGASWPIRVEIELGQGLALFSGRKISTIPVIQGSGGVEKIEWTVIGKKGSSLVVKAKTPKLGSISKSIVLN